MASAAASFLSELFHRMEAQPSGEITEYTAYCSISSRSQTPMASAPPEPPSPITTLTMGTSSVDISNRLRAMASLWPRSSLDTPG